MRKYGTRIGDEDMPLTFNPKEAIAFIAKSIVLAATISDGVPPKHAEITSETVEGIIKGFSYKIANKSICQQLNDTIRQAVESVQLAPNYEIPNDCTALLMNAFSFDKAVEYLQSSDALSRVKTEIIDACSKSDICDITTLPLNEISEKLLQHIYTGIYNNHELSTLITLVQVEKINKALEVFATAINSGQFSNCYECDTPEYAKKVSTDSAKRYASKFNTTLFSERGRKDSLRLCDVYVDSILADEEDTKYNSFAEVLCSPLCLNNEVILIEGEPGSGKSTMIIRIAYQYLTKVISCEKNLFFVQGKEIRHSEGKPIEDILNTLNLKSVKSLNNSIVILDAYDEISYPAESPEKNQEYFSKLLHGCEGFVLIITSRSDYVRMFAGSRLHLRGFSPVQRRLFLNKYNNCRSPENQLTQAYIETLVQDDSSYEDGIYELLSIPMLLYMIAVSNVNIAEVEEKFDLYEIVFALEGNGAIYSRRDEQKFITKKTWSHFYSLALSISKSMLFDNDAFISESRILSHIDGMDIPMDAKNFLRNRFGIEILLSGTDTSIYTFVHRSIYEYFAAKYICSNLKSIINQYLYGTMSLPNIIAAINNTFPSNYFSESVFFYVMYAIRCGYVIDALVESEKRYRIEALFQNLLASQLCNSGDNRIPYIVRLKNLFLWVFNSFSVMFGMFGECDNTHWIKMDHSILQYILRIKEPEDTLMIARCNLRNISFCKYNLGSVFFIDNDLTGAAFWEATCSDIVSSGQKFCAMNIRSADFCQGDYSNCAFDKSDLRYTDFRGAILRNASFRGADLRCCHFDDAEMQGADFTGAHIYLSDFENAIYDDNALDNAIVYDPGANDPSDDLLY